MTVERIIAKQKLPVARARPETSVADIIRMLSEDDVGALLVSADGEHLVGIISERDIVRALNRFGAGALNQRADAVMTREVITCAPTDRVAGVMALMDKKRIRHVPVTTPSGKLCGIVSVRDIIKLRLHEVQDEADAMRQYILSN